MLIVVIIIIVDIIIIIVDIIIIIVEIIITIVDIIIIKLIAIITIIMSRPVQTGRLPDHTPFRHLESEGLPTCGNASGRNINTLKF